MIQDVIDSSSVYEEIKITVERFVFADSRAETWTRDNNITIWHTINGSSELYMSKEKAAEFVLEFG